MDPGLARFRFREKEKMRGDQDGGERQTHRWHEAVATLLCAIEQAEQTLRFFVIHGPAKGLSGKRADNSSRGFARRTPTAGKGDENATTCAFELRLQIGRVVRQYGIERVLGCRQ